VRGMARGVIPYMSSKGVCVQSACQQLLWVNSRVGRVEAHVSGCSEQYMATYASISWLTCSVAPLDCG